MKFIWGFPLLAQIHILVHGHSALSLELRKKLYYTNQAGKTPLLHWQKCKVDILVDWFLFFFFFLDHLWVQLSDTTHVQGKEKQVKAGSRCWITPQCTWTLPMHPPSSPIRVWHSLS